MVEGGDNVTDIVHAAARADVLGVALLRAGCRMHCAGDHIVTQRGKLSAAAYLTADGADLVGKTGFGAGRS